MNLLERYLVEHCAPTLAAMKVASLFNCAFTRESELQESLDYWNHEMCAKGVRLMILKKRQNSALVYVCRFSNLGKELQDPAIASFLKKYGYEEQDPVCAVEHLKERLALSEEFPHEIGIFLGYPLGDVIGFIQNIGRNCQCMGCWKVYCNKEEAQRTFCKYQKCKDVYTQLWENGSRSVCQLTVAA